ncbi:ComF family protein [Jiangella asiatica]|nr:phosphoribosyltransferase family protein [Jiangella asiatica]
MAVTGGPGRAGAMRLGQRLGPTTAGLGRSLAGLARGAADLVLGDSCAGCGEHPGLLCPACRDALLGPATVRRLPPPPGQRPHLAAPEPANLPLSGRPEPAHLSSAGWLEPVGLPLAGAAAYADPVRAVIIAHKERGRLPLSRPLGDALAVAATALLESDLGCGHDGRPVALVPVPSRRSAVRRRGHDPVLRTARRAAATLRRSGQASTAVAALRHRRKVADQAGLGRSAREHNLHGSLAVRRGAADLMPGRCVLLADDIVTSGATLREAVRALASSGVEPCGAVVVAVA